MTTFPTPTHAAWCKNHLLDTDGIYGWCEAEFSTPGVGDVVVSNGSLDGSTNVCVYLDNAHSLDAGLPVDAALDLSILLAQAAAAARHEVEQVQQ